MFEDLELKIWKPGYNFTLNESKLLFFTLLFDNNDRINYNSEIISNTFKSVELGKELCFNFTIILHNKMVSNNDVIFKFFSNKKSWTEASEICKNIGGYLPYFTSRQHLEEFLALYNKFNNDIPTIIEMFIGLKYNVNKVVLLFYGWI